MNRSFLSVFSARLVLITIGTALGCLALLHRAHTPWLIGLLTGLIAGLLAALWVSHLLHRATLPLHQAMAPGANHSQPIHPTLFREFNDLGDSIRAELLRSDRALTVSAEARQELEAMLDSMQDAVVAVDTAGRIQWTNQRMQRLVPGASFSNSVRIGHALVQTIRDPDVLECVRSALQERQVSERRSTTLIPGRIFEVSAAPTPGGGAVAVLHDITRIEQMERTQRDFVANVSHELRTPLTSITGYVETLLDHEATLSPQAREFLTTILKNATRMNRLTEELLVMARVEAAEQELHPLSHPSRPAGPRCRPGDERPLTG